METHRSLQDLDGGRCYGMNPSSTSRPLRTTGILINMQFPGPQIDAVTNDNIVINVFNNLI
uniref:Plastocyanin-like domain-containing protein n=1 Tax=Aegilops tauschii subsp. strangulata TaxID=200361 RepID=A0A453T2S7_AEGTS